MSSKLEESRRKWKEKAVNHANKERYLRKENKRIKKERDKYKKDVKEVRKQLKEESCKKISPISDKESLIYLALRLFLIAKISFRGVSRVLEVVGGYLGLSKAPCPQTIINWVTRLSISRMQNAGDLVHQYSNNFICMIDISIGLGVGKILSVLFLDSEHHIFNEGAPTLQNVHCVGVSVSDSWTGEKIADFLQKVFAVTGKPVSYLKDGGTNLSKAVEILNEQGYSSFSIDDVSHIIANLLKHEYQEHPMFDTFISTCGKISNKFKQTVLACIVPPKISTKARFMNIHRLVKWANQLLKQSPRGRVSNNSLIAKLRAGFEQLPECKAFISSFLRDANSLLECQRILKTNGLSQVSFKECIKLLQTIPQSSDVRIGFTHWAEKQLSIAKSLGLDKAGMPVSSDSIESLFGVAKQRGTGEIKDANRIALRIPSFCGKLTKKDAKNVLNITVKEQQTFVESIPSLLKQRRQVLSKHYSLDSIQSDLEHNIELIPVIKNQSKYLSVSNISDNSVNKNNHLIPLDKLKKLTTQTNFDEDAA